MSGKESIIKDYQDKIAQMEEMLKDESVSVEKKEEIKVDLFYYKWWINDIVLKN